MPHDLDYSRAGTHQPVGPLLLGRLSCANVLVVLAWTVWGTFRLIDAFYSGPGRAPFGPDHKPWWYIIYGGGAVICLIGVLLALAGVWRARRWHAAALVGLGLNGAGLLLYVIAIPYPT